MSDFEEFKKDTLRQLWREGDADLERELPRLTRRAERRLRVDLKYRDLDIKRTIQAKGPVVDFPSGLDRLRNVNFVNFGPGVYVTQNDWDRKIPKLPGTWPVTNSSYRQNADLLLEYTTVARQLYHRIPASEKSPVDIEITYSIEPPSFVNDNTDLYNDYTSLFEQAVYSQCYYFLEDDAGLARAENFYAQFLEEARNDQNYRTFGDGPLKMRMPRRDVS